MTSKTLPLNHTLILNALLELKLICPNPKLWDQFYKHYKQSLDKIGLEVNLPPPMILGGWWTNDASQKNNHFLRQLIILKDHELLNEGLTKLTNTYANDWYTIKPPRRLFLSRESHILWPHFEKILE